MMPTQVFLTPDGKEFFRNEGTTGAESDRTCFLQDGASRDQSRGDARSAFSVGPSAADCADSRNNTPIGVGKR